MPKVMGIDDKGNPMMLDYSQEGKPPLLDLVDKIHDGVDDMLDWARMGNDYHIFVQQSFEHALAAIDLLVDALREHSLGCEKCKAEFDRFLSSMKNK